jgi:hypothetical protein
MISAKRQPIETQQPAAREISGKYVIIAVVAVALTGAAASWFFRYNATHRAASLWGFDAKLIRDAPIVEFLELQPATESDPREASEWGPIHIGDTAFSVRAVRDVSHAPGFTHLRNALLEDRSYDWPASSPKKETHWRWALEFTQEKNVVVLVFTDDCTLAGIPSGNRADPATIPCLPIAAGLREMFNEFSSSSTSEKATNAAEQPR